MKARPKRLLPSRLKKIDSSIRLSKGGKRIQDMQFWEEAAIDLLGYTSYLEIEVERLGKGITDVKDISDDAINEIRRDTSTKSKYYQDELVMRENRFKRQVQQLQLENSRLKMTLLKYERNRK